MAIPVQVIAPRSDPTVQRPTRTALKVRAALLLLILSTLLVGALVGQRPAALDDLREGLRSGRISAVTVVSSSDQAARVQSLALTWREGWGFAQRVDVVQVTSAEASVETSRPVIHGTVEGWLREIQPGLTIQRASEATVWGSILGLRVPAWMLVPMGLAAVGVLALLTAGAEPRYATRWAWFWLLCVPGWGPIVAVAFLAQGMTARPPEERRLTGGWAFLIALVVPKPL